MILKFYNVHINRETRFILFSQILYNYVILINKLLRLEISFRDAALRAMQVRARKAARAGARCQAARIRQSEWGGSSFINARVKASMDAPASERARQRPRYPRRSPAVYRRLSLSLSHFFFLSLTSALFPLSRSFSYSFSLVSRIAF